MTPIYSITVDGGDITAKVADRLISLRITDEAGIKSDTVSLTLDNRDNAVAVPRHGVIMKVSLGYAETDMIFMGAYTVDEALRTRQTCLLYS